MDIIKLVTDLEEIEQNIKTTKETLTILKKRKTQTEQSIMDFLNYYNQPGFTYKGKLYAPKETKTYKKKQKHEKYDEITSIFKQNGIQPDSEFVDSMFTVFKHKPVIVEKLMSNKFE